LDQGARVAKKLANEISIVNSECKQFLLPGERVLGADARRESLLSYPVSDQSEVDGFLGIRSEDHETTGIPQSDERIVRSAGGAALRARVVHQYGKLVSCCCLKFGLNTNQVTSRQVTRSTRTECAKADNETNDVPGCRSTVWRSVSDKIDFDQCRACKSLRFPECFERFERLSTSRPLRTLRYVVAAASRH
jgi:hypothetical protein